MGFAADSEGILNRFYREGGRWNSHLENTKQFILDSAQSKEKNVAVILGSGWLLDVPFLELSEMFEAVYLVDIIHSRQVKHKISKLKNVHIIEHDISGGALEGVYSLVKKRLIEDSSMLDKIKLEHKNFGLPEGVTPDFVASVNILSQLDYFAINFLRKHTPFCNQSLNEFKKRIQKAHLSFLPKGKTCLITDYNENIYNDKKVIVRQNALLKLRFAEKQIEKRWKWYFDSHKTYYSDGNTFMNVLAVKL